MSTINASRTVTLGGIKFVTDKFADVSDREHPLTLLEWVECHDFVIAMAGIYMGSGDAILKSLRHLKITAQNYLIAANERNSKIRAFLPMALTHMEEEHYALEWAVDMLAKVPTAEAMLATVTLKEKREVLRYMKIVSTAVAAAYLGITEDMLNDMKRSSFMPFGAKYTGGYCYSLEELNLIAQNLQWTCDWVYSKAPVYEYVDDSILDHAILVDEATAVAMTGSTPMELRKLLNQTEHTRRPYRLSDLEKIRVAKLNRQQQ